MTRDKHARTESGQTDCAQGESGGTQSTDTAAPESVGTQTVTVLHAKWQRILNRLDTVPGWPTPRREARLVEAGRLEREIGRTPAQHTDEILLKLRMVLSGRITAAFSESALPAGAIEDVRRSEKRSGSGCRLSPE